MREDDEGGPKLNLRGLGRGAQSERAPSAISMVSMRINLDEQTTLL